MLRMRYRAQKHNRETDVAWHGLIGGMGRSHLAPGPSIALGSVLEEQLLHVFAERDKHKGHYEDGNAPVGDEKVSDLTYLGPQRAQETSRSPEPAMVTLGRVVVIIIVAIVITTIGESRTTRCRQPSSLGIVPSTDLESLR